MRSERERLLDIQEAITRIEKYAKLGKDAFLRDELIQNWIVSQIAIIGEACRALPDEFHPGMPMSPGQILSPCAIS